MCTYIRRCSHVRNQNMWPKYKRKVTVKKANKNTFWLFMGAVLFDQFLGEQGYRAVKLCREIKVDHLESGCIQNTSGLRVTLPA